MVVNIDQYSGQIFRIGTVRYAEGLWCMRRHGPVIAHCTDSEDFPYSEQSINHIICSIKTVHIQQNNLQIPQ